MANQDRVLEMLQGINSKIDAQNSKLDNVVVELKGNIAEIKGDIASIVEEVESLKSRVQVQEQASSSVDEDMQGRKRGRFWGSRGPVSESAVDGNGGNRDDFSGAVPAANVSKSNNTSQFRIFADGLPGNTSKDVRVEFLKKFLDSLGTAGNVQSGFDIFCHGPKSGKNAIVQFKNRDDARQFLILD